MQRTERDVAVGVLDRAVSGEQARLAGWADRYAPRLYRAAALATGDDDLARDLVQEVFLVAARRGAGFAARSAPYTWLYGILKNLIRTRRRTERRRADKLQAERPALRVVDPEQQTGRAQDRARVRAAVAALPEAQQAVVALFYLEERSVAEVAAELGLPPGTVKSRLHEARAALRWALERGEA